MEVLNVNVNVVIVIEESIGKILYLKDVDKLMGIVFMIKMMDEYLLLEVIDKG